MPRQALPALFALLLASPAAPQTVDELIAKSLEARGGLERLRAVQSLRMTGTVSAGGRELKTVIEVKRPASIRVDTFVDGRTAVQAFDGTTAWGIAPTGAGRPEVLPPQAARAMSEGFDIDGPLVDYRAKGHRVELLGKEKVAGRDAWKIRVSRKTGGLEDHFLDASSFLPVRVETRLIQGGVEGESTIGDYREAGGLLWPYSIRSGPRGSPDRQVLTVERIEVNPPLDDARFRMTGARPADVPKKD
jgi:hypothetical protein